MALLSYITPARTATLVGEELALVIDTLDQSVKYADCQSRAEQSRCDRQAKLAERLRRAL